MREAVALYRGQGISGGVDWGKVSYHMGGTRSYKQCASRWRENLKLFDSGLMKEGPWTEDEVILTHWTIFYVMYCLCIVCMNPLLYTASILDIYIYSLNHNVFMIL